MQAKLPVIPNYANQEGDKERSACLRELAVALRLVSLGDEGRGEKVLRAYANDPRGAYAKYATGARRKVVRCFSLRRSRGTPTS